MENKQKKKLKQEKKNNKDYMGIVESTSYPKSNSNGKKKELSNRENKLRKEQSNNLIRDIVITGVLAPVLLFFCLSFFFTIIQVHGFGMVPTVRNKEAVIVTKTKEINRFDLLVFASSSEKKKIRRVIGLPGENIRYEKDILYVNGTPITEKFIVDAINDSQKNGRDYTENFSLNTIIPEDFYLVLGDNRPYATDSRHYGLIHEKYIIGKVRMRLMNFQKI